MLESIIWLGFHRVCDGALFNVEPWFPSLFQFTFLFSQCVHIMMAFGISQLSICVQCETWINPSADVTLHTSLALSRFTSAKDVFLDHFHPQYFPLFYFFFLSRICLVKEEIWLGTSWDLHGNFRLRTEWCLPFKIQIFVF